jgi:hypothetical protein
MTFVDSLLKKWQSCSTSRNFIDAIFGFLRADMVNQARAESVVLPRLRMLAGQ